MKTLKKYFAYQETFVGLASAFAFLLIFFCIWMTAYDGVTNRTDGLKIGLVNQDEQIGSTIQKSLLENLPFDVKIYQSIQLAKTDMNQRELDMVMLIPKGFSKQIQGNGEVQIEFFINQANASLAKQMMDGAAKNITNEINENVFAIKKQITIQNITKQMESALQSKELAQNVSNHLVESIQLMNLNSVQSSVQKTNNVEGFAATMVPMMIVLASFVGSMIMSMNINIVSLKLRNTSGKWSIFLTRQIINLGASISLSLITILFMMIFNISFNTTLFETWLFQTLVFFAFLSVTQMFVILFGSAGMVFNIISLSVQLVTSGVIVPRVMLSSFYQTVGSYFPATYAANGYYTVIFGGEGLTNEMMVLVVISTITLLVTCVKVVFQKNRQLETNENAAM